MREGTGVISIDVPVSTPNARAAEDSLREITKKHGVLLIFDEVMTGFRVALGGAQALYGIAPDLTVLGKVIGGGLPIGALAGRAAFLATTAAKIPEASQAFRISGSRWARFARIGNPVCGRLSVPL